MAPLIRTNPYLRSLRLREKMLIRNAVDSSVFEGARGLRVQRRVRAHGAKAPSKAR